ncbi:MAG TPA: VWA domain-containing protein [Candidatus Udaeobacter sp.]|nr:VWA domain-containing protein [Candidatus Udaeobacter sp.]
MEFLNPTALYGLFALPLLLVPYLIRRKPRRVIFSSLLLFRELASRPSGRPWGNLRLPPIFFLQLLLLILLILALGEPVFSIHPTSIAVILDNSASMQTLENGKTRFALAKENARTLLADIGLAGKVDIYLMAPRLEKLPGSPFAPLDAAGIIAALEPYDLGEASIDYSKQISQMATEQRYDRIYLITDHPGRSQLGTVRVISVGGPKDNLAIVSFQVRRSSLANARLEGRVEVRSFSAKEQKVKVLLRGAGAVLASRELAIAAGKSASVVFDGFALHPYYEVEIEPRDALALDNRQFAVPDKSRELRILGISPRPQALASLRSIPGVMVDVISAGEYERTDRSGYGLEIFHFSTPAVLPRTPALFILPPDNNSLVQLESPMSRPMVSSWREPHPLTRYVNFALFRPSYARSLKPKAAGESIIESPNGPLAFAAENQGVRHLVLGFDPFPYLGRENLPVSIFTMNFLDWFFDSAAGKELATGKPLSLGVTRPGDWLITPQGEKISLKPGSNNFSQAFYQGIYQLNRAGERESFAINLQDPGESDLREPSPIEIRGEETSSASPSLLFSFWPYLLLASLLLMLIEWFVNPRRDRLASRSRLGVPSHL